MAPAATGHPLSGLLYYGRMADSYLTELRLDAFKSVKSSNVPLEPVTLIVGRNGSGKSNILDGVAVLSALATGADLRDALDGGREGPVVRGGSEGCAPLGQDSFKLGCTAVIDGIFVNLDLEIQVRPNLQISSEKLWTQRLSGNKRGHPLDYLASDPSIPDSGDIAVRWENRKRGTNPAVQMRANQLLTSQVATRVPATSAAGRDVHRVAEGMLRAISSSFLLDPVPHQMREYVPEKDNHLRRTADNLSAVINRLLSEDFTKSDLLEMTNSLSEAQVSNLSSVSSDLGDVMITIDEKIGGRVRPVPARLMSDGTLRFLSMAAAMLDAPEASLGGGSDHDAKRMLVIEELENGLHPSQAALLLGRFREAANDRGVRTLATTHSPAILDALEGEHHESVLVTSRDEEGWSQVNRLVDFPDYIEILGKDSLGSSITKDRLRPGQPDIAEKQRTLEWILGA